MENSINQQVCRQCAQCIKVCPCNILTLNSEKQVHFLPERLSICLQCGQCMAVCTTQAIKVQELSYGNQVLPMPETSLDATQFTDFLATRRSVRNFKTTAVPSELLQQIVDSVAYAPYGSEPQKMHITVVNNRNTIEQALPQVEQFLDNVVKWMENPFMRFIIRHKKGHETYNTIRNHLYPIAKLNNYKLEYGDRITRGAPAILLFHADAQAEEHTHNALINATYAMLTAHSLGLGATMIGIVPAAINKVHKLKQHFGIPTQHDVVMSVVVGYPKIKYHHSIKRSLKAVNWVM